MSIEETLVPGTSIRNQTGEIFQFVKEQDSILYCLDVKGVETCLLRPYVEKL